LANYKIWRGVRKAFWGRKATSVSRLDTQIEVEVGKQGGEGERLTGHAHETYNTKDSE